MCYWSALEASTEQSPEVANSATTRTNNQPVELSPLSPPPPPIQFSIKIVPVADDIIQLNKNIFDLNRFGQEVCSADAARKKRYRSVKKILDAILLDENKNKEQQGFALREPIMNKTVRAICGGVFRF